MKTAAKRARPAVYRWVPYVLVVAFSAGGAYLAAEQANDPAVVRAARETRDRTYPVDCLEVVEPVGPADPYVPPAGR